MAVSIAIEFQMILIRSVINFLHRPAGARNVLLGKNVGQQGAGGFDGTPHVIEDDNSVPRKT